MRSLTSLGDVAKPSGRRRASRSALLAAQIRVIDERRPIDGLDKRRAVGERGDGEEVDKVVPGLLVPQGADGEAGAPA